MKKKDHLPVFGIGPVCIYLMAGLLLAGLYLDYRGIIDGGKTETFALPMRIMGVLLIAAGIFMWIMAVAIDKIGDKIVKNHLLVTGMYAYVRNPVYSAFAIALTGVCLLTANLVLLVLPVLFWLDITLLMKFTEEKWLSELYGKEYEEYCRTVNRCIPWFPKEK